MNRGASEIPIQAPMDPAEVGPDRAREEVTRTFAAGLCNELDDPLSLIVANAGFATGLVADVLSQLQAAPLSREELRLCLGEVLAALHESSEAAGRVRRLSRDLRTIAAPVPRRVARVDLAGLSLECARAVGARFDGAEESVEVEGDAEQLEVVIEALVENALESGGPGSVRMRVLRNERAAVVEVIDSGPGLPPRVRERVFDPFFTTRHDGSALGLGLPVARALARAHGGDVTLEGAPGQGAVARLVLPLVAAP